MLSKKGGRGMIMFMSMGTLIVKSYVCFYKN